MNMITTVRAANRMRWFRRNTSNGLNAIAGSPWFPGHPSHRGGDSGGRPGVRVGVAPLTRSVSLYYR